MPDVLTIPSPAKLNLALAVGPPGAGGMHPICSWMAAVDLADELTITRLEDDRFSRYAILWHTQAKRRSEIDWPITRDLAVRAHLAIENRVRRRLPVQMKLEKRIPVGGGMGGGSSNAAAMLVAINRLFELELKADDLARVGAMLGSDVPFFVQALAAEGQESQHAIVEGLGDRIESLPARPPLHAVTVFPDFPCPTGAVYRAFDASLGAASTVDPASAAQPGGLRAEAVRALAASPRLDPAAPFNDLAPAAMKVAPGLAALTRMVASLAERPAHITGSGSTVFVLCDDALHAEALAAAITQRLELPAVPVRTL